VAELWAGAGGVGTRVGRGAGAAPDIVGLVIGQGDPLGGGLCGRFASRGG